jgi:hypothetical protein
MRCWRRCTVLGSDDGNADVDVVGTVEVEVVESFRRYPRQGIGPLLRACWRRTLSLQLSLEDNSNILPLDRHGPKAKT